MIEGATDDELVAAAIVREWPPGSLANALVKALRKARAEIAEMHRDCVRPPVLIDWIRTDAAIAEKAESKR